MSGIEQISIQIVSAVGTARSCYIEAIREARSGNFEKAKQLIQEGKEAFALGHEGHFALITQAAEGRRIEFDLILMHAEDQMMSAEMFGILANEFIETYKLIVKSDVLLEF